MFTGIIETIGTVREMRRGGRSATIAVLPDDLKFSVAAGGSVALDGACLTLESSRDNVLYFTAVEETLDRTTIGSLRAGGRVNLERALALCDRLDGHFVLGHVDAVASIVSDQNEVGATVRTIRVPAGLLPFVAEKGSVAVDGISLTVVSAVSDTIGVSLIPFTLEKTTMGSKRAGDRVNIECDVIARYLARLTSSGVSGGAVNGTANDASVNLFDKMERSGF